MIKKWVFITVIFLCHGCWVDNNEAFNRCAKDTIRKISSNPNYDILSCENQKIENIKYVAAIENIKNVILNDHEISSLKGISKYKNITNLSLQNNQIEKIDGLENLDNLWGLDLTGNPIQSIKGLCINKKKLEYIHIEGSFNTLSELVNCKSLKGIYITSSNIYKLDDLPYIHDSLTQLQISNAPLNHFELINKFKRLKNISFANTNIENITPLKSLVNIETLALYNNKKLIDISTIVNFKKLRFLNLTGSNNIPCKQIDLISKLDIAKVKLPNECVK